MELTEPNVIAAAAHAIPAVFTVFGVILNTDQLIAATHAAISVGQLVAICAGIWAMVSTSRSRAAEYDKRHRQIMDDQKQRHEETMAAHRASMVAQDQRHQQVMDDQNQRHQQVMDDQKQRHEESMKALEELIRRTASPADKA